MRGTHIPVTSIAAESKFVELVRGWLVTLPHDLKIAFDAMDDENLPRPVREVAAGVIAYVISPNDFVSDRHDAVVSYADDAVRERTNSRFVSVFPSCSKAWRTTSRCVDRSWASS